MRRLLVGAAAAAALGAATLVVLLPNVAQAAAGCQVTYTTNDWTSAPGQGGFTASLTVQNLGDPVSGWTLRFAFPSGQTLTQGWSATWAQSAANVSATNLSWNANLGTGASTSIGFNGTWTGSNAKPTGFTLNGVGGRVFEPAPRRVIYFGAEVGYRAEP